MSKLQISSEESQKRLIDTNLYEIAELIDRIVGERIKALTTPAPSEPEVPLSIEEAADFVGLKKATLYGHTSARTIPFHRKGKRLYFYKSELSEWIKEADDSAGLERQADQYIKRNPLT